SARSATPWTTRWPRPPSGRSRTNSSAGKDRGVTSTRSSWRPPSGWCGSTPNARTSTSTTSPPRPSRSSTTITDAPHRRQGDSTKTVSGLTGTGHVVWVVRHGVAAGLTVLQQVRRAGQASRDSGGVQAGDGAVRRCGALDGHRSRGGYGAVARDHHRAGGTLGGGGTALRRDGGVHRRRGDGDLRRPDRVGRSRFSRMSGRAGHPGGDEPVGGRGAPSRQGGAATARGPEFGPGDRR